MVEREPCPDRILDDIGGAFAMGAVGGGIWHTFKGARMSSRGERIKGAISAVKARSPVLGGLFLLILHLTMQGILRFGVDGFQPLIVG